LTAQFPCRCDQTSRSNRNIGKSPQGWLENRKGMPVKMSLSTRAGKGFLKVKGLRIEYKTYILRENKSLFQIPTSILF